MPEREMLEEQRGRPVQQRAAQAFRAPNHVDESALVQRLEHTAYVYSADLLHLRAADRLAIGDDRERLERGGRQALRTGRQLRALDRFGVLRASEDLPAAADLGELHAMSLDVVVLADLVERGD